MVKHSQPDKLPVEVDYGSFAKELADAQYALGLLEGLQRKLVNLMDPELLVAPLTAKEATVSSKIEGTQSNASDVFLYEAGGPAKYRDTAEVSNYRRAMTFAIDEFGDGKPFGHHFIKSIHTILLNGVRHRGVMGNYRQGSVWIAEKYGDPIEKATYVPPENLLVSEYMENFIHFLDNNEENTLVLAGMAHYQFEAVHPFDDGNGRIGRLLIPFLLHYKNQLTLPIIYLSGYFDKFRDEYIDSLHSVDISRKYEPWITFFLKAVKEQSRETIALFEKIYSLYDDIRLKYQKTKSPYISQLIDFIFKQPVLSTSQLMKGLGISRLTAGRYIKLLEQDKFLTQIHSEDKKTKYYLFAPLLRLL